ncbi:hypothetical protein FHU33_1229 [Blastococcus colisei]|uniref:Uncharacterized protein n=1 Tax=Blastococcus colisei TaxID=1564162 RepID=A0A543PCP3_9ACTN|nr:hypothetical protein [Blastococcus colisei]TQN41844.1 hypothetical protein FHU33_1229 [Blastococcus colisei]
MRDYNWIAIGGGFTMDDDATRMHAFMRNAGKAQRLLDAADADLEAWRDAAGIDAIHLVLETDSDASEPEIDPMPVGEDRVQVYAVRAPWLVDDFVDEDMGAWQLVVHVVAVLMTIHRETGLPLPAFRLGAGEYVIG